MPIHFTREKDYLCFLYKCLAYISANNAGAIFTSNKKKISFILSYMKEGTISTWAQNYYNSIINAAGVITIVDNFEVFLKKLNQSFKDLGEKDYTERYY